VSIPDESATVIMQNATLTRMNLPQALQRSREILDQQVKEFFTRYEQEVSAVDPITIAVAKRLHEYSAHSGKAARPLLVAVGAALSQNVSLEAAFSQRKVQLAMLIIELTHKRILMADDVADQDEQRHGFPSFHLQWEQDLAIDPLHQELSPDFQKHMARSYTEVAGIIYQNLTYYLMADKAFSDTERRQMLISLQKHTYDPTPTGWYLQFLENFRSIAEVTQADLYRTYELITGEYSFVNPLQLGALLGRDGQQYEELFVRFGYPAGVLFQITDDIIGVLGDSQVSGKPVGNDFREGKKSLLVQYAYRQGSPEQKTFFEKMIGNQAITNEETQQVTQLLRDLGAEEYTRSEAKKCADTAQAVLRELPDGEAQTLLRELIEYILQRQK